MGEETDGPSFDEAVDTALDRFDSGMQLLTVKQQPSGDWVMELAGDGMGPARLGHMYGFEFTVYASEEARTGWSCCIDFVTSQ